MARPRVPARTLRRRFCLGSGSLKRTSDRVEFLSRVVLLLALLLAVPAGLIVGAVAYSHVLAAAGHEAATRFPETATLLEAAPASTGLDAATPVPAAAIWTGPGGARRTGPVDVPPGSRAGAPVGVWVDGTGRIIAAPLTHGEVVGQGVVLGVLTFLGFVIAGMSSHLVVLWLLEGHRSRRWAAGWAAVEPLWVSRFR